MKIKKRYVSPDAQKATDEIAQKPDKHIIEGLRNKYIAFAFISFCELYNKGCSSMEICLAFYQWCRYYNQRVKQEEDHEEYDGLGCA